MFSFHNRKVRLREFSRILPVGFTGIFTKDKVHFCKFVVRL
jgi:hypothetical protein